MPPCPSFTKSQLLCRFPLLLSGTACFRNPIDRPCTASPKSQVFSMRTAAQNPIIYPRRLNYEFTGFIHASVLSLMQRNPEFRPYGKAEKPCKYRDFSRRTPRDFAPYGNRPENRENAYSRSMNLLVNTHLFCLNFLFILPGANGRNSGSHEVSGSIPLFFAGFVRISFSSTACSNALFSTTWTHCTMRGLRPCSFSSGWFFFCTRPLLSNSL